jgi:hypothetical protein
MTVYIGLSLAVAIIGALVYIFSAKPKVEELARLSFFAGLLAFLLQFHSLKP